jgi:hypothetical protein
MRSARPWRWAAGVGAAALSAVVIGVPTDMLDTDLFTRMTPIRWWEYPVLGLAAVLTGLWVAIPHGAGELRGGGGVVGATTAAVFAVGCPICNKIVVGLLGVSGALGIWAPIQPILAVLSLAALAAAVVIRWRSRHCTTDTCAPQNLDADARRGGDSDVDGEAAVGSGLGAHLTTMGMDDGAHDGQAEAGAPAWPRRVGVGEPVGGGQPAERFEQAVDRV